MSLPPGFLDELRTRTSIAQVVGRKVIWDARKSNQGKGDMWAPCPFHQEKSASFHVDDRKGFYYCFGCHAKGDALGFIKETENVSFMEAVEIMAREAGMQMPARDPQAQKKADRRSELTATCEAAAKYFKLQLKTTAGSRARDYLEGRGLSAAILERFEIGFAPDNRQGLWSHLTGKGIKPDLIIDAGLCAKPDHGGPPYDRFRDRIIYPIRDPQGRCIGFGGRAMSDGAKAKYLNSPETALFDKGRSLYNFGPARKAAGKGHPLIVTEGYMDVIALVAAGFEAAVAPLGTAITEDQLRLLWRISPEPILALDGDAAGQRAAARAAELALPMLSSNQTLQFTQMEGGLDPDDYLKLHGKERFLALIDKATPLVTFLWLRETAGQDFATPEQKARLDNRLKELVRVIQDRDIQRYYWEAFKQFRWERFRPQNWAPSHKQKPKQVSPAKNSFLARSLTPDQIEIFREEIILALCLRSARLVSVFLAPLEDAEFRGKYHALIRQAVLKHFDVPTNSEFFDGITADIGEHLVKTILNNKHIKGVKSLDPQINFESAKFLMSEQLAKLETRRAREAVEEIIGDWGETANEALTWRAGQAGLLLEQSLRGSELHNESSDVDWGAEPLDVDAILKASEKKPKKR